MNKKADNDDTLLERLQRFWKEGVGSSSSSDSGGDGRSFRYAKREKIIVFIIAFILALGFWLLVNLSRSFNVTVNVAIEKGAVPEGKALGEPLPDYALVSVEGEGWKLISFYNNPPQLTIDLNASEINLFDQVRQQMNNLPNVTVLKVQPSVLSVQLENEVEKRVPVALRSDIEFKDRYRFLESPRISPDSITIIGANSMVSQISELQTEVLKLSGVKEDISTSVPVQSPNPLVSLSRNNVRFQGNVAEYTEGEVRVFVRTRGAGANQKVNFSPQVVTIKYDVPIQKYADAQEIIPYSAFVDFEKIRADSSGFVTPEIVKKTDDLHLELRSFQPKRVAYFQVVEEKQGSRP